jgi:cellulose synthase/poly-beta-1,6-N-acetylglucosamine synthase-like glycosyltransferase
MSSAQTLYVVAFSVYLIFFVLFTRFIIWKAYSEKKYWNRRLSIKPEHLVKVAEKMDKKIPYISILVPARNESVVIENTIHHLRNLDYPKDKFEIVVVTDEKESLTSENDRQKVKETALLLFAGEKPREPLTAEQDRMLRGVLLSCLSEYALTEYLSRKCQKSYSTSAAELLALDANERCSVTRDISLAIVDARGAPTEKRLKRILKKNCPHLSSLDIDRIYPTCLSVAVPVIAAYACLSDGDNKRLLNKTIQHTAKANHELTKDIIMRMTDFIARRVMIATKKSVMSGHLERRISRVLVEIYPTTQEVVDRVIQETKGREHLPALTHVVVPWDFDGLLNGSRKGVWVPSTKGRALNWAIPLLNPETDICGFYDAESRPAKDVLLYVGYRRLIDPEAVKILQGPVFQVRNFYQMTPFCRIASLYQAVAHDWYLPWLFRTLPFVGGTNVYIDYKLLNAVGGWDCRVLTEDLEFGARAYLMCKAWPEYLPYPSSEQTPPTFKAFFRQRLRWGTGHLQVVDKISSETAGSTEMRRILKTRLIIKGQVEWIGYQMATFVPPTVLVLQYRNMLDPSIVPNEGRLLLSLFSVIYMSFTFYALRRYKGHVDTTGAPEGLWGNIWVHLQLLLLPLAAFMFPVPYTSALFLKSIGKEPRMWVKTPRTEETRLVS